MKRSIGILACLVVVTGVAFAGEADGDKLTVEAVGVRVSRGNALKERLIWPTGTTVALQVSSPQGEFIRFDAADSTVTKFVDDKGTDLQARSHKPTEIQLPAAFGNAAKIDKESKNCLVEFTAPGLPAKGASHLELHGTVTMLCAIAKTETVVNNVPIKSGTKFTGPGNLELQIEQVGRPEFGKGAWGFLIRSQREIDEIAEMKFFRADGTEIPSTRTTTSTLAIEGAVRVEWNYTLNEQVNAATIKIYSWRDAQKKRVKLELKINLGL